MSQITQLAVSLVALRHHTVSSAMTKTVAVCSHECCDDGNNSDYHDKEEAHDIVPFLVNNRCGGIGDMN